MDIISPVDMDSMLSMPSMPSIIVSGHQRSAIVNLISIQDDYSRGVMFYE
jgi:hypothetical protein